MVRIQRRCFAPAGFAGLGDLIAPAGFAGLGD
jgi:hypothetical protein